METNANERRNEIDEEIGIEEGDNNGNSSLKPFLSRLFSKTTPISYAYHQVEVAPWTGPVKSLAQRRQQLQKGDIYRRIKPVFLASRVQTGELDEYLNFVQTYYEEKIPDYFTSGIVSKERTLASAMKFLHSMDYNYIKAKFYILFPYYLAYNSYRCHEPLRISIQDMKKKISDHMEGLRNTKEKDTEKWIENLEAQLANRTNLQRFLQLVEQGKQNKYEIPEEIKEQIEKSQKMGKDLRKSIQGVKLTIEELRAKKEKLEEYRLVTNEMINFQDTFARCEEWISKQEKFQSKYFQIGGDNDFILKNKEEKIEFKQLQLLVVEYNNLPLLNKQFEKTTRLLHQRTVELVESMPNINKIVKTRTSKQMTVSKIPYKLMQGYLKKIENHPIWHEQFGTYESNMRQSLELIQRMNMFLEDPLSEKNSKVLNNYIKLISDVQIENNVEKRLKTRQECNDIIDKIKRQISNPGKVESIKDAFNKLREKGIREVEDLAYQEKIMLYLGWYQSQEKLRNQIIDLSNLKIIEKELFLRQNLVDASDYRSQLESAKKQWNINEQLVEEAENRLKRYEQQLVKINETMGRQEHNLQEMISLLKQCINNGLMFPEMWQLYDRVVKYFVTIAKIHSLLIFKPENINEQMEKKFIFTSAEADYIVGILVFQEEMKTLKTKQKAEEMLAQIKKPPFPNYLQECVAFEDFIRKGEQWSENVRVMMRRFTEEGANIDLKELDSRYYIHSRAIKDDMNKIQSIMRWREKISKKLEDGRPTLFSDEQDQFLKQLEKDLNNFESTAVGSTCKQMFLEYCRNHHHQIQKLLTTITNDSKIENICKLSEMNKFHRQIEKQNEKHKIEDKKILELKQKFKLELLLADDWKQRYVFIKRFEKKKIRKEDNPEVNEQLNHHVIDEGVPEVRSSFSQINNNIDIANDLSPDHLEHNHVDRKKIIAKNGQFTWYFKFLIMILQFSKGYKLKFCLEELLKLKNSLVEIEKLIGHFEKVFYKKDPLDTEIANLEAQSSKVTVFLRQIWLIKKKNAYINSWKTIADAILESVPIVSMELKARKPEQLLTVLAHKKQETEEKNKNINQQKQVQSSNKRQRKPNSFYFFSDITQYTEQNLGSKPKKKKKGDSDYRNTAVGSQTRKNPKTELEEIERTEAMIKAGVQAGTLIQDFKQYCICRYGQPNQNTTMVQCEGKCEQWFHIECVGIKKNQTKSDAYICVACSSLYDDMGEVGSFFWDYKSKISEYAMEEIVEEGRNMGVQLHQLKKITAVYDKIQGWKASVNEIIQTILKDDLKGKGVEQHEEKLYELYLLSLWLPTFHHETSTIKRLLLLSRGEKLDSIDL